MDMSQSQHQPDDLNAVHAAFSAFDDYQTLNSSPGASSTSPLSPITSSDMSGSSNGKGNTFVRKLYNILMGNMASHAICWSYGGSSFMIRDVTDFSQNILPQHFKHNNFSSFVRQLNMYGFHKINKNMRGPKKNSEGQLWEFSHPKFIQGRPELLNEVKRRLTDDKKEEDSLRSPLAPDDRYNLVRRIDEMSFEMDLIRKKLDMHHEMARYLFKKAYPEGSFELFEKHVTTKVNSRSSFNVNGPNILVTETAENGDALRSSVSHGVSRENSGGFTTSKYTANGTNKEFIVTPTAEETTQSGTTSPRLSGSSNFNVLFNSSQQQQHQQAFFSAFTNLNGTTPSRSLRGSVSTPSDEPDVNAVLDRLRIHTHSRNSSSG